MRLALAILCLAAAVARADSDAERAAKLFEEGKDLAAHARYQEACDRFAKSYDLDPAFGTGLNFADCQEHLGHLARAWQLFDASAATAEHKHDGVRAQYARDRADALAARLGEIVIRVADPDLKRIHITIGGRHVATAAEVHERADPGDVEIVAQAPERRFATTAHVAAKATTTIDVPVLERAAGAAAPASAPAGKKRGWVIASLTLGGASAGAAVFGAVMGIAAARRYNDAFARGECYSTPSGDVCNTDGLARVANAHDAANLSTGLFVGSALLAGAAVIV